ncbi:hypothetical protein [Sphingomonas sp. Leaf62]|uniref:hypothetical protein n=1 Tax=Sphingomonas sp. Leaf62 TaxID=1736228 RepID=UPI000AD7AD32|nr:hypothetical protein [Sphingomonas sp. Leaf62]
MAPTDQHPAVSRRFFLGTSLYSLTIPALSGTGLFGVSACHAEIPKERALPSSDTPDDHRMLQSMFDKGGTIILDRTYSITDTLYLSGKTHVRGTNNARIVWIGPANRSIIRDTSTRTPSIHNRNITLENFEIDGGDLVTGGTDQFAIEFYRTGNVILRRLVIHGVGGSGVRWGNSYLDTTDILVENCTIFGCRVGDALQGSGRRIMLRDNVIGTSSSKSNFGDTGIALLMDFDRTTNPEILYSSQVQIVGNHIQGNYRDTGFTGVGGKAQTGIACGPFSTNFPSSIKIENNRITGCYVNIWLSSMKDVTISENFLGRHYSNLTGNIRLDNISDAEILYNKISTIYPSNNSDTCAILIQSRRIVHGNSIFDGDVKNITIAENIIYGSNSSGIRIIFGEKNIYPQNISRISDIKITGNSFFGISNPVSLNPVTGETSKTFIGSIISNNISDKRTTTFISILGKKSQYSEIIIQNNQVPDHAILKSGTGTNIE